MKSLALAAMTLGAALLAGCDAISQARSMVSAPGDVTVSAMVDTAAYQFGRGDAENTLIAIAPAATPASLATLSELRRHAVLRYYAWSLAETRHYDAAAAAYRQLSSNAFASESDRSERLRNAAWRGDPAEVSEALAPDLAAPGDFAGPLSPTEVGAIDQALGALPEPGQVRRRLIDRLEREEWPVRTDPYPGEGVYFDRQLVWLHYAQLLADAHDPRATLIAARITRPDLLIAMQADRRFDAIIAADPDRYDPDKAAGRALAAARAAVGRQPESLLLRIVLAQAEAQSGDDRSALATLDEAIATARGDGSRPGLQFTDRCDCIVAAELWRVSFLSADGRPDEALAELRQMTARQETNGNDMRLRQARLLLMLDRSDQARAQLAALQDGTLSLPMRMEAAALRACAAGDRGEATGALAYLEAHRTEDIELFLDGELCAGDAERTAGMVVALLRQPARQAAVLYQLQLTPGYRQDSAYRRQQREAREALAARPDVAAAANAAGHLRRFTLRRLINGV